MCRPLTPTKVLVLFKLHDKEKLSYEKISGIFGKGVDWAGRVVRKHNRDGKPKVAHSPGGRPRKFGDEVVQCVDELAMNFRTTTSKEIAQASVESKVVRQISNRTMRTMLHGLGFRKVNSPKDSLTEQHKQKRIKRCEKHQRKLILKPDLFNSWIISDGVPQIPSSVKQEPVMIWGAVSYEGPVALVCVTGVIDGMEYGSAKTMNSLRYRSLLTAHIIPYREKDNNRLVKVFQQDSASIHVSKIMQTFFQQERFFPAPWPAKSPDFRSSKISGVG
ncbi:hypothetical protein BV898_18098 [Hypsibius exemplaris]|uniref:Transposase Tc1-like domain-containing protein n=1 Tax=Hypsibius exemplaris TaxID=2072580 RepID=A0A9X6RN61_HYPEX|nr:hypothetical protein BV898_18098 [Hypsibius exemplaris]